jgi:hypothetical protein
MHSRYFKFVSVTFNVCVLHYGIVDRHLKGLLHVQCKEYAKVQQPGFVDLSNVAQISQALLLNNSTPKLCCCAKR